GRALGEAQGQGGRRRLLGEGPESGSRLAFRASGRACRYGQRNRLLQGSPWTYGGGVAFRPGRQGPGRVRALCGMVGVGIRLRGQFHPKTEEEATTNGIGL